MMTISKQTARRFIMGRQGLWPGRRWRGREDLATAVAAMEAVQEDPLNVVARSHDIALASRIIGYRPEHLEDLLYAERRVFEYGGALFVYPMSELPYWRLHMARHVHQGRFGDFAARNPELLQVVRAELRARGPLGNRDFAGATRVAGNYRGRKDSSLALYYMWLTGEVLVHHRTNFQRIYDFRDRVAPPEHDWAATEQASEAHFARKNVAFYGLITERGWRIGWASDIQRKVTPEEARVRLAELKESGIVQPLRIEGSKDDWLMLGEDLPLLEAVDAGRVISAWRPLETTTEEEAVILAPLEIVSARGRAKWLFDFEYIWEVYKPAEQRRWGYYTVPILYGDRLVARLDPRYDRGARTLTVLGFWLEPHAAARDVEFADALGRGLGRFAAQLGARRVELNGMSPAALAERVARVTAAKLDGNDADNG